MSTETVLIVPNLSQAIQTRIAYETGTGSWLIFGGMFILGEF